VNSSEIKTIIDKKVKGKIVPQHTEEGHYYKFVKSDIVVRSVTTKLIIEKPHLIPWAVEKAINWFEQDPSRFAALATNERKHVMNTAKFIFTGHRDDAGNVGSSGHTVIENWVNHWIKTGEKLDIRSFIPADSDLRVFGITRSAEAFFNKNDVTPIASELLVGMKKYNSAGTLDMLVLNNKTGCIELWDWKSSNAINQDTYPMQIAAYKKFFEHMSKLPISVCKIIKLDKYSDSFKAYTLTDTEQSFKAFASMSFVYDWKYDGEIKLKEDKNITIL